MPAMYEELQLALWKLGLDRVPEKYTLQDLEVTFRYQSPLEYFVLRLLEGEMNLLDAVSAIYTVIAPPRPIMAQVLILSSGFRSITELRQEIDRMIESSAQFGSTCFFPVRGWLVGLDGEMEPARDAVMLQNAEVIGEAVQRMQSWIIHDMALCFADTETESCLGERRKRTRYRSRPKWKPRASLTASVPQPLNSLPIITLLATPTAVSGSSGSTHPALRNRRPCPIWQTTPG